MGTWPGRNETGREYAQEFDHWDRIGSVGFLLPSVESFKISEAGKETKKQGKYEKHEKHANQERKHKNLPTLKELEAHTMN